MRNWGKCVDIPQHTDSHLLPHNALVNPDVALEVGAVFVIDLYPVAEHYVQEGRIELAESAHEKGKC